MRKREDKSQQLSQSVVDGAARKQRKKEKKGTFVMENTTEKREK